MKPQKLTWEKVDKIRELYVLGNGGYKTLAKMFNVSPQMIKSIIKGKTWAPEKDWRKKGNGESAFMPMPQ